MPDLRELAQRHRLRYRRAEGGKVIIPGKRGHIGEWGDGKLYWVLWYSANTSPKAHPKDRALQDPRLTVHIEGDQELVAYFDAGDLWGIATEFCAARRLPGPRVLSEPQRRKLALSGMETRFRAVDTQPLPSVAQ